MPLTTKNSGITKPNPMALILDSKTSTFAAAGATGEELGDHAGRDRAEQRVEAELARRATPSRRGRARRGGWRPGRSS